MYRRFWRIWPALMVSVVLVTMCASVWADTGVFSACGTNQLWDVIWRNALFVWNLKAWGLEPGCPLSPEVTWSVSAGKISWRFRCGVSCLFFFVRSPSRHPQTHTHSRTHTHHSTEFQLYIFTPFFVEAYIRNKVRASPNPTSDVEPDVASLRTQ